MKKRLLMLVALILAGRMSAFAQEAETKVSDLQGAVDGINESLAETKTTVDALKKIKISGYIQAQYQVADTQGNAQWPIGNFAGGSFPANVNSRFAVRRGRVKVNYDNDLTQFVLQIDVTQNGVGIKDAYASIKDPWYKTATFTGGIFDRPFGFEISYSSSQRESPERSRMFQTLFPGERETGVKLEIAPPDGFLSHFNAKGGFFNGVLNTANENDSKKDFIGRLGFTAPFQEQNLAIDGGVSIYSGNVTSNAHKSYTAGADSFFVSSSNDTLKAFKRQYLGLDAQVYYDLPVLGGASLRYEYITGDQPGTSSSGSFYNPGTKQEVKSLGDVKTVDNIQSVYRRKFSGWYINYIQNVGLKNQFVVKLDFYDPNTKVKGSAIGNPLSKITAGQTSAADIAYATLGLGWIYHWDSNVKFVVYYDMVSNEKISSNATDTKLIRYKKDVQDNVFTFRMQYKF